MLLVLIIVFCIFWYEYNVIFVTCFRTNEVQQELQEFRECSEDIEKELEAQLEQNEKQMKELKQQKANLVFECDALKVFYYVFCFIPNCFTCCVASHKNQIDLLHIFIWFSANDHLTAVFLKSMIPSLLCGTKKEHKW